MPKFDKLKKLAKLPMDEVSRLARAKEMGFNPNQVFYHGTKQNIESFDPSKMGSTT